MVVAAAVRDAVLRNSEPIVLVTEPVSAKVVADPIEVPDLIEVPEPTIVEAARADAGAVGEIGLSATVEHAIIRARRRDQQLAVLMVEVEDVEAVFRANASAEATASAFASVAEAAKAAVSAGDVLIRETAARTWIVAPACDATKAHALAGRVTATVRALPLWCGVALTVSVGIAVLDEDGADTTALIDAAEAARSGASASRE
jgi:GGDEF domain-containing protein